MTASHHRWVRWALIFSALVACYPTGWTPAHRVTVANPGPFDMGPYLLSLAPGRMAVVLKSGEEIPPSVDWWLPEAEGTAAATPTSVRCTRHGDLWVAILEDLPIGKTVAYRVRSGVAEDKAHEFKAGAVPGEPFRFAVFGDTRTGHEVHQAVVNALHGEHIDFVVHTGDLVAQGGLESDWHTFFAIERELLSSHPMFAAVGNHDDSPRQLFRRYFLSPMWAQNHRFYSMDWGNLRIVVVDPLVECREGCSQYIQLDKALEEGAARDMLMIMVVHHPPYSSGAHGSNGLIRDAIGGLAIRHGVEVVFSGHDHNYERTEPIDGVTYVVSASAGAPARVVKPQGFSAALRTEPHYVLVDVSSTGLTLRAVNLSGDTFDSYLVKPLAPRGR